jgi:hypothetical protein
MTYFPGSEGSFLSLIDSPSSYSGETGKVAAVNAAEDGLEFIVGGGGGGATDFLTLTDTPASYVGQGGKVVAVNVGETALEFVAAGGGGGGGAMSVSERRLAATQALGGSASPINFEIAGINDNVGDLTWDAVNYAWENTSGDTLEVNIIATLSCQDAGSGRPHFELQVDTGGGFTSLPDSDFWSEVGRMSANKVYRLSMAAGDKVAVAGNTIVGSVNMINDSTFQVVRAGSLLTGTLPSLPDNVEVPSGRALSGKPTYLKLVRPPAGAIATGATSYAHGIVGLDEVFSYHGVAQRDNGDQVILPFVSLTLTFMVTLNMDATNMKLNVGSSWTGAGNILSDPTFMLEYSKL